MCRLEITSQDIENTFYSYRQSCVASSWKKFSNRLFTFFAKKNYPRKKEVWKLKSRIFQKQIPILFEKPDKALPLLTDLKTLYNSVKLNCKQLLLQRVFEGGLTYDGSKPRTPRLNFALLHNYHKIKEKGLLFWSCPMK